jgi:hypothetical protein
MRAISPCREPGGLTVTRPMAMGLGRVARGRPRP